jgi:Icc-related predicted phosphoesterase
MRIAATADLHYSAQTLGVLKSQLAGVRDEADVLVVAGDLTNFGRPEEMEPLVNVLVRLRIPIVAVLGNHDYECGKEEELIRMMTSEGIKVLDGTGYERNGVGFAGTKGFVGGFGRGVLTAFGEPEIKAFVKASIDEAMKLERAMSQLRTDRRVVVLHYAPIAATIAGEAPEIYPYLGSSRLAEVVDRHGADFIVHGHAHHGCLDGKTTTSPSLCCSHNNLLEPIGCSMSSLCRPPCKSTPRHTFLRVQHLKTGLQIRQSALRRILMSTILIIILVLLLIGALPTWPYSSGWGYYPSGGLGLVVLVLVVLLLAGRL